MIDALCADGVAKILAEPQLTVLNFRTGRFLCGGEVAISKVVGVAGTTQSVSERNGTGDFRELGTSVQCTPTVMSEDRVQLSLISQNSTLNHSNAVQGVPGLNVRRIETLVEMRRGQSVVLGGLTSQRHAATANRIPFLGDIPEIGHRFATRNTTTEEHELLVVITPEIIIPPKRHHDLSPVPGFDVYTPVPVEARFNAE